MRVNHKDELEAETKPIHKQINKWIFDAGNARACASLLLHTFFIASSCSRLSRFFFFIFYFFVFSLSSANGFASVVIRWIHKLVGYFVCVCVFLDIEPSSHRMFVRCDGDHWARPGTAAFNEQLTTNRSIGARICAAIKQTLEFRIYHLLLPPPPSPDTTATCDLRCWKSELKFSTSSSHQCVTDYKFISQFAFVCCFW